uniref:uncharacterized protein n=1 Tax=Myxine glutinosa TaxID=7769 RepID=UPI00358F599F
MRRNESNLQKGKQIHRAILNYTGLTYPQDNTDRTNTLTRMGEMAMVKMAGGEESRQMVREEGLGQMVQALRSTLAVHALGSRRNPANSFASHRPAIGPRGSRPIAAIRAPLHISLFRFGWITPLFVLSALPPLSLSAGSLICGHLGSSSSVSFSGITHLLSQLQLFTDSPKQSLAVAFIALSEIKLPALRTRLPIGSPRCWLAGSGLPTTPLAG